MKKKRYDVVVVGCGPGGSIAGKFAALNGAETLIIEDKRQFGFPVYDPMSIIFGKSDMEEISGVKIEPATIYAKAEGAFYVSPSGKEGKRQPLPDAIFVNRNLFEKSLATCAARAGAEIMLHTKAIDLVKEKGVVRGVVVKNSSGLSTIPCTMVIAADGSYQQMGRLAGIEFPGRSIRVHIGAEFAGVKVRCGPRHDVEVHLDDSSEGMYRSIVPYADDRFSIQCGIGTPRIDYRKSLKQRLGEMIKHLEETGRYDFSKASPVNLLSGGWVALTEDPIAPRLATDGIILVGQAAGSPFITSKWGGWSLMYGACWTGRAAGIIAAAAVRKGDVSEKSLNGEYRAIINQNFGVDGPRAWEAHKVLRKFYALSRQEQDSAVEEVGRALAALHYYSRGCLASPLPMYLEPAQNWLKERGK